MGMFGVFLLLVIGLGFFLFLAAVGGFSDATASDAAVEHEANVEEFNNSMLSPGLTPWLPNYDDDD